MYSYVCVFLCVYVYLLEIRKYMKNLFYNDNKEKIVKVLIRFLCSRCYRQTIVKQTKNLLLWGGYDYNCMRVHWKKGSII